MRSASASKALTWARVWRTCQRARQRVHWAHLRDADRKEQFMVGLTHEYLDFARQTLALKGIPRGTGTLEYKELTDLVTVKDVLRVTTALAALSSSSSRKGNTDRSYPSLAPSPSSYPSSKSPSPPSTKPPSDWLDRAVAFQSKNPEATKASWHRPSSTPSPNNMWCYNCTKYDSHFSTAYPNARRDPKKVVLAAFASLSLGAPLFRPWRATPVASPSLMTELTLRMLLPRSEKQTGCKG
ncbi:hypothetical protein DMC30DRAFT_289633 [Rhodotorula diobovata]|uniref:Uncharacterized protein n=1 Tax=Rhodotorula diobovata TaxID=5288 RepID=A0A5C5FS43_9BASI|nr:hypothetical protein DMC30DRAFT_289633 [Rhodotorula diobovata]